MPSPYDQPPFLLAGASGAPLPLYVIDDHEQIRESLKLLLSTFGINAVDFVSGLDFLEQLPALEPAPLLLDITMSGMDGVELLEQLAVRRIGWPVMIMTGLTDAAVAMRARELGAMEVLHKPFSAESLELAVTRAFAALAATA